MSHVILPTSKECYIFNSEDDTKGFTLTSAISPALRDFEKGYICGVVRAVFGGEENCIKWLLSN